MMNNNLDKKYTDLQKDILINGADKTDRTGTGTYSVFGRQIRHDMSEGYPLLTTKEMSYKTMIKELLWFINGDTNIRTLVKQGCNIWNGDAYKYYVNNEDKRSFKYPKISKNDYYGVTLSKKEFIQKIKDDEEFAKQWGDLGPIYGKQWRKWKIADGSFTRYVDQFDEVINTLINNPDSRRMIVSAWNVSELEQMKLPPCHYSWQLWSRKLTWKERSEIVKSNVSKKIYKKYIKHAKVVNDKLMAAKKQEFEEAIKLKNQQVILANEITEHIAHLPTRGVSLMWNQRSVDTFLGLPFNIASYGLLLELIAQHVNMVPLELIGSLGDTHLYKNHIEQAKEQIKRKGFKLPKMKIKEFKNFKDLTLDDFELIDYKSNDPIKAPLSN